MNTKKVVLSGIRPTAGLHLGNILGAVNNMVKLQDSGKYEGFFFIADYHAATTNPDFRMIRENTYQVLADMLSVGLDPKKSIIFRQSDIPELPQLYLLFSYLTTVAELERNPVYKEQKKELHLEGKGLSSFLLYPVLQAADICLYKGELIPVGKDQEPHIEITREIARRANTLCGKEIFPIPQTLLTEMPKVPGIDGRKMSKSYNNYIALSDTDEETNRKVNMLVTDSNKPRLSDPGHPEDCHVFQLMRCFINENDIYAIKTSCVTANFGCIRDCKPLLAETINTNFATVRLRRSELLANRKVLEDVLNAGAEKAGAVASETMKEVREAVGIDGDIKSISAGYQSADGYVKV
ncbi:MAG: tryptophan--tRNA ligase [Nitrospirota bacterium]